MAIKLTQGLNLLHRQGIAHGDIHPRNIVISHDDSLPPYPIQSPEQAVQAELVEQVEQGTEPIDIFAADIYNLGKTLETELTAALEKYDKENLRRQKNYQGYSNLLSAMTDPQPGNRSTVTRALATLCAMFQPDPMVDDLCAGFAEILEFNREFRLV
ncbi:hypothetical protein M422DRAFT_47205 [Sphaerobolus stellatus SS14]|uniref:Protein kinase domain-containing protein n=1 Tax=Sphaerobolus stellatus (strain SS14) TaxID=990650 RepID=A0A0C9VR57_SPHS4|nr:hypothetical protein M422DRAFT_47205 [Sphaerobolus stellatus SS14]